MMTKPHIRRFSFVATAGRPSSTFALRRLLISREVCRETRIAIVAWSLMILQTIVGRCVIKRLLSFDKCVEVCRFSIKSNRFHGDDAEHVYLSRRDGRGGREGERKARKACKCAVVSVVLISTRDHCDLLTKLGLRDFLTFRDRLIRLLLLSFSSSPFRTRALSLSFSLSLFLPLFKVLSKQVSPERNIVYADRYNSLDKITQLVSNSIVTFIR